MSIDSEFSATSTRTVKTRVYQIFSDGCTAKPVHVSSRWVASVFGAIGGEVIVQREILGLLEKGT
ncbi:MAG: hypothetical protein ACO25P_09670, partial [Ilumatobacteraceae bacterium]